MRKLSILICLAVILGTMVFAEIPRQIIFQGKLSESPSGGTAAKNMLFRIFDAETAGNQVGKDILVNNVQIKDGIFTAILPIDPAINFDRQYWVDITIGNDRFAARQVLTSVPYAFHAAVADRLAGERTNNSGVDMVNIGPNGYSFKDSTGKSSLFLAGNGRVGIGTTDPNTKMQIEGDLMLTGHLVPQSPQIPESLTSKIIVEGGLVIRDTLDAGFIKQGGKLLSQIYMEKGSVISSDRTSATITIPDEISIKKISEKVPGEGVQIAGRKLDVFGTISESGIPLQEKYARKDLVDTLFPLGGFVKKSGDTITGTLTINSNSAEQLILSNPTGSNSIISNSELRLHTPSLMAQNLKVGGLVISNSYGATIPPANGLYVKGNADVAGAISEGGVKLSDKYALKSSTQPEPASNGQFSSTGNTETLKPYSGAAVYGKNTSTNSSAGVGVFGSSTKGDGVSGQTSTAGQSGVIGNDISGGQGRGVSGLSPAGIGVYGESLSSDGVQGKSTTGDGVHGVAAAANKSGVYGNNSGSGYGVYGGSTNGIGVYGSSIAAGNTDSAFKVKFYLFENIGPLGSKQLQIGSNLEILSIASSTYLISSSEWIEGGDHRASAHSHAIYNKDRGTLFVSNGMNSNVSIRVMLVYR